MSCPFDFQQNCRNLDVKCHDCKALNPLGASFYYVPLIADPRLLTHPYYLERKQQLTLERRLIRENIVKNKQAKQYNSKGHSMERKVIKSIAGAKLTYNSGALNGDGDGYIWIDDVKYGFGHKMRFSGTKNRLGPTTAEWTKGHTEGTDFWLTTSNTYGTIVTMKQRVFDELIELIQRLRLENEQLKNERYQDGRASRYER